jgi:hypothetical protein
VAPLALPASLALTAASTAASAASTIAGGRAAQQSALAQQQALEFRARQEEAAAQEARALAGRAGQDKRREVALAQSKLQARAAASGGGADDSTIVNLSEDIASSGEYAALMEMYKGESRARSLEDQATGNRYSGAVAIAEGNTKRKLANLRAIDTIIGGANSMVKTASGLR